MPKDKAEIKELLERRFEREQVQSALSDSTQLVELEDRVHEIRGRLLRLIRKQQRFLAPGYAKTKAGRGYLRDLSNYAIREAIREIAEGVEYEE